MKKVILFFVLLVLAICWLPACISEDNTSKIVMPKSTSDYIGSEWTVEALKKHFEELGFTNISAISREPTFSESKMNILDIDIETGWFSTGPWEAGDDFKPDVEITIYHNTSPCLTVENCTDLALILSNQDGDYQKFCAKYDGRYVEFDAYVIYHLTYDTDIIEVAGGIYDNIEINGHNPSTYQGLNIRIGNKTWDSNIDESVEVGDRVKVRGRIDLSWAKYFKCVYVETISLSKIA